MLTAQTMSAQNFEDLLRYSQKFYQSDARAMGAGNAFGAVGADPISMSINPAGIGLYRKNEFSFGLGLESPTSSSTYMGGDASDFKYNLNVGNIGLIIAGLQYDRDGNAVKDGWVSFNFGFGFNRTNSFQSSVTIDGANDKNNILDDFANQAHGQTPGSWEGQPFSLPELAIRSAIIQNVFPSNPNDSTNYASIGPRGKTEQKDIITSHGSMNDITLSFGGNYSNRVYVGATIGFPTIGYHMDRTFTETHSSSDSVVRSVGVHQTLNTSGIGVNATLGAIVRLTEIFRVGASIQTPTFYSMSDDYTTDLSSDVKTLTPSSYIAQSPQGSFDYSIVTPFRFIGSLALVPSKNFFLSADYEYINYANGKVNYTGSSDANYATGKNLVAGNNIRVGAEYKYDVWSFRGGLGYYSTPYNSAVVSSSDANGSVFLWSLGAGYRYNGFYIDFAYQVFNTTYSYYPYPTADAAKVTEVHPTSLITLGWRF